MSSPGNSYASQVNSKYRTDGSYFVDLKDRLNNTLQSANNTKKQSFLAAINMACAVFERLNPNKKKMEDLDLCESIMMPLSDILIDVTMQRMLILSWVIDIINNWRDVQCQPIQVYKVLGKDGSLKYYPAGQRGLYASWDGQHTAMALYILCVYVFKQDPSKVMVPVTIYKVETKADIRANFVKGNSSEGKRLLDAIDIFMQQVYGVRLDGAKNKEWEEAELKQQYLENAELFVTAEKFGDTHMPGAISRMQEINGYTSDIIRQFCLYATTVMEGGGRPIASQEIEIMCAWLDMARKDGVDYTDEDIVSLAMHINSLFGADFHESSDFWNKARRAYENWWKKYWAGVDEEYRPAHMSFSKNWRNGGAFLWHQLKHTWTGPIPKLNINTPFKPADKDLYNV
jgi:uncharacterized protein YjbI with pentapeptide repeats